MHRPARLAALAALVSLLASGAARADADTSRRDIDLWPLFVSTDEETTVLYPLYVHEDDFTLVFPAYARTRGGRDHHFFWPLVKLSDARLERAAPFWFSHGEGEFTFVPFLHQTREGTLWMLPPVWLAKDDPFSVVFPLYLRDGERWWAAPNLYVENPPGDDLRVVSLGVFDWEQRGDARALSVALLARSSWDSNGWSAKLWPALGGRFEPRLTRWWVGPLYREETPSREATFLLPVFGSVEEGSERLLWVGPVYSERTPTRHQRGVFPALMHAKRELGSAGSRERLSILWPLYTRSETRDALGAVRERDRRFLIFRDELERDGTRRLRLLGLPIWERTSPDGPGQRPGRDLALDGGVEPRRPAELAAAV